MLTGHADASCQQASGLGVGMMVRFHSVSPVHVYLYTVVANEIPKNHSEASRGVLKSGCAVYNCINVASC